MPLTYRTVSVDGLKVFYRDAGDPKAPAVLLLHGFPTSSHMFRDLIPALADRYHVVAPDLPGFGFTDAPDRARFKYTFDHLADVMTASPRWWALAAMPSTSSTTARRWAFASRSGIPSGSAR